MDDVQSTGGVIASRYDVLFAEGERFFGYSRDTWDRHTSPWSVWTRVASGPLLFVIIWARVWVGWWWVALAAGWMAWIVANPFLFPKPKSTDNWAARATFGERLWLKRKPLGLRDTDADVLVWGVALLAISSVGFFGAIAAAWLYELPWLLLGIALMYGGKLWYLDRMVWLYERHARHDARLAAWVTERR